MKKQYVFYDCPMSGRLCGELVTGEKGVQWLRLATGIGKEIRDSNLLSLATKKDFLEAKKVVREMHRLHKKQMLEENSSA